MRFRLAIFMLMSAVFFHSTALAEQFPYKAYISGDDVYIRSGPGKNYYPTDMLQRGVEIEVWRHDPGGWYAVRPPEDSFSWVSGKKLKLLNDNVAEVAGEKIVAYVGSKFSDVHDVRQIKMDRGELVEILGEKRFVTAKKGVAQTWYKIAPPSGEFRWVFGRFVVRNGIPATTAVHKDDAAPDDEVLVDHTETSEPQPITKSGNSRRTKSTENEYELVSLDDGSIQQTGATMRDDRANEAITIPAETLDESGNSDGRGEGPDTVVSLTRLGGANGLNLELSMIIAEPPSEWNFDELRDKAQASLNEDRSAVQRGTARLVLREIEHYENLRRQYNDLAQIRNNTNRENRLIEIESTRSRSQTGRPAVAAELMKYDGIGHLTPVVSKRTGAPQYALTDSEGKVLMFVTPAADLKLRSYVGKKVGLSGTRGYMPQLKKAHLTAQRVQTIESKVSVASKPDS